MKKYAHISVDDVWICLNNLICNGYQVAFDEPFLKSLKNIHDETGMCITLNTFNSFSQLSEYHISKLGNKYQNEFKEAKKWLKFAFHAESDQSHYWRDSNISDSYDVFVDSIINLTGDSDCIDRVTRLGFFEGTLENVLAIRDKTLGVKGLLCADSVGRKSYYLSDEENDTVQKNGRYFDKENGILFLKTVTRNNEQMANEIEENLNWQSNIEVFHHEYEGNVIRSISNIAKWLKDNGYIFEFVEPENKR